MLAPNTQLTIPSGAWDAHMHVTDTARFPPPRPGLSTYKPTKHTLHDASQHASALSLPNLVFIQPSTYGTDNSCILWCLEQRAANTARGVVVIDPLTVDKQELREWHELGVRGVRVNLKALNARPGYEQLRDLVRAVDAAISHLPSWGIHFYVDSGLIPALVSIVDSLGGERKICIDHMASPSTDVVADPFPWDLSEWEAFRRLLERDNVFVKISAPYRVFEPSESWEKLEGLVKDLLAVRGGDAVVFASDWPHTRFGGTDVAPWVELCLQWCGEDDELREKLFVRNAERLYDVKR